MHITLKRSQDHWRWALNLRRKWSGECQCSVDLFVDWHVGVKSGRNWVSAVDGSWSPVPAGCNWDNNRAPCSRRKRLRRCRTCFASFLERQRSLGRWGGTVLRETVAEAAGIIDGLGVATGDDTRTAHRQKREADVVEAVTQAVLL